MSNPLYRAERCRDLAKECSRHHCTLRPLNRNAKPLFADIEHYSFLAEAEELGTLANDH
jgi:hypothetical protein